MLRAKLIIWIGLAVLLHTVSIHTQVAGQKKSKPIVKEEILEAEGRLSGLGYWTGPVD
jgi:hypothetical protein